MDIAVIYRISLCSCNLIPPLSELRLRLPLRFCFSGSPPVCASLAFNVPLRFLMTSSNSLPSHQLSLVVMNSIQLLSLPARAFHFYSGVSLLIMLCICLDALFTIEGMLKRNFTLLRPKASLRALARSHRRTPADQSTQKRTQVRSHAGEARTFT